MKNIIRISLLGIMLILMGCAQHNSNIVSSEKDIHCIDEAFIPMIELGQAKEESVSRDIPLTGVVESNPDKVLHFISLADGVVSDTYFSLGDRVEKGQLLAELRSIELSELYAQSLSVASQLKRVEKKLETIQTMYEDGITSLNELMEVRSEREILKAEKEKIDAHLQLYSASAQKGVFQIKSPISGFITSKSISRGAHIYAGGEPLFTVSDLSEVWVWVNIHASNMQYIEEGMKVKIKTLAYPDMVFEGEINVMSQVLDAEARVLKAGIVMQNKDLKWKPGMFVDVVALEQLDMKALRIPTQALIFDNNQNYVVVYRDKCDIEIRLVDLFIKNNEESFLVGGLKENERIVTKNQLLIYEQIKNFQY